MAPKTPDHVTQTTEVKLPAWVDAASQSNYNLAKDIAAKPYNPYTGQSVADQSQLTLKGYDMLTGGLTNVKTGYNQASGFSNQAGALANQAGKGILSLDRSKYMNPFTKDVIDTSITQSQDALKQSLMSNADKAVASKAFGGSRGAIVDGVTTAQSSKDLAQLIASLNSTNFGQATSAMQGDISNKLAASGALNTTAGALTSNQDSANKMSLAQMGGLLSAGQQQQQYMQSWQNNAESKFNEANNHDAESLNVLLSALGMSPYGKTEVTDKTGMAGSSGTDFAQMGLGILSLLPALAAMSDRRVKKNIKRVGKHEGTGIPIYEYNYKHEKMGSPIHRGPMAQDVEKKIPGAVVELGGIKVVDKQVHGILANG